MPKGSFQDQLLMINSGPGECTAKLQLRELLSSFVVVFGWSQYLVQDTQQLYSRSAISTEAAVALEYVALGV